MKKTQIKRFLICLFALSVFSCSDTSDLENRMDTLENRVTALEKLCAQLNTNVVALQTSVTALQENDYITNITEIKEGNKIIGYSLSFAKNGSITIYNGKDGADGKTPIIGVKQFTDGLYYWTLDGEFLTDSGGNKVKANGTDGKDGVTPKFKIENDSWFLSLDNGQTWTEMGKASGEDGDSFFASVKQDENYVFLNLIDGTTISLLKEKVLTISFDESIDISITAGATKLLKYTIIGATSETIVKALGQNGWSAEVTPTNNETGNITVKAPDPMTNGEILVLVYDGKTRTIMSSLNFVTGVINVASNAYSLPKEASRKEVKIATDIDYIVEIPENAKSWLSVASTRSAMRSEILTFVFSENKGLARYATVYLKNNVGKVLQSIAFEQQGGSFTVKVITPGTLSTLLTEEQKQNLNNLAVKGTLNNSDFLVIADMSSLKYLDMSVIENTILPNGMFHNNKKIIEVKLPEKLLKIPDFIFKNSSIQKCPIPKRVTTIGNHAFYESNLSGNLILPQSLISIEDQSFRGCTHLSGDLILNEGLVSVGFGAFFLCSGFNGKLRISETVTTIADWAFERCDRFSGDLYIPNSVTKVGKQAFSGCKGFSGSLTLSKNLKSIDDFAFQGCSNLKGNLVLPENLKSIGFFAFNGCNSIDKIYSKNLTPPSLKQANVTFPNYKYLGVPFDAKDKYINAEPEIPSYDKWSNFLVIEEVDFEALGL